jgi:hypothetical protein
VRVKVYGFTVVMFVGGLVSCFFSRHGLNCLLHTDNRKILLNGRIERVSH